MKKPLLIILIAAVVILAVVLAVKLPGRVSGFLDDIKGEDVSDETEKEEKIRFQISDRLLVNQDTAGFLPAVKVKKNDESSSDILEKYASLAEITVNDGDIKQKKDGSLYIDAENGDRISCKDGDIRVSIYGAQLSSLISEEEVLLKLDSNVYLKAMKEMLGIEVPEVSVNRVVRDLKKPVAKVYITEAEGSVPARVTRKTFQSISMYYDSEAGALIYELRNKQTGEQSGQTPLSYSEAIKKCNVHEDNILRGCEAIYVKNENTGWYVPNYVFYFEDLNGINEIRIPLYDI